MTKKKARLTSADAQELEENLEDSFSKLPDDILVNIVSWLTVKEAARTSVLSRRWKYLWRFTSNLDLDGGRMCFILPTAEQRSEYVCWVNKVLELHRGSDINKFRIGFSLDDSHGSDIINWIHTAMAKKVRNLELDMQPFSYNLRYTFPQEWYNFLKRSHDLFSYNLRYTFPQEWYNFLKRGHDLSSIKSLRSLHLNNVDVSGEVLEFFLHSCPLLEDLFVMGSSDLLSLKVVGSSIPLKYLCIQACYSMKQIEISASSLISFKYFGQYTDLHVGNVPQLVDMFINVIPSSREMLFFGSIESCFPQLKTFELVCRNEVLMQFGLCELPKLIHLKLIVTTTKRQSLLGLTLIMKACPFLQKLVLQLRSSGRRIGKKPYPVCRHDHQHLRLVEFLNFRGKEVDLGVAIVIIENAARLEKMVIEPEPCMNPQALIDGTNVLKAKLPEGVELVVGSL